MEAIDKAVNEVAKFDAGESVLCSDAVHALKGPSSQDDWFVITITDANFARYAISEEDLHRVMTRQPKVHTALICIGEGAEALWYALDLCALLSHLTCWTQDPKATAGKGLPRNQHSRHSSRSEKYLVHHGRPIDLYLHIMLDIQRERGRAKRLCENDEREPRNNDTS